MSFDISWDEVAKYAVATPESITARRHDAQQVPGSVSVRHRHGGAGSAPGPYFAVFDMWAPVWRQLTPEASLKVRKGNYERIFDEGRRRVRDWEKQT